jgi:hypothetical protein
MSNDLLNNGKPGALFTDAGIAEVCTDVKSGGSSPLVAAAPEYHTGRQDAGAFDCSPVSQ